MRDLLTRKEHALFRRCDDFLWAVRCHLHFLAGRAEERLSFDVQPELARRLGYQKHPGLEAAERFMKHYFLVAKDVGDLTRIVCAELEEREAKNVPRLNRLLRGMRARPKKLKGSDFTVGARAHQRRRRRCVRARPGQSHPHFLRGGEARPRLPPRCAAAHHQVARPHRPRASARRRSEPHLPRNPLHARAGGIRSPAYERSRGARPLHS